MYKGTPPFPLLPMGPALSAFPVLMQPRLGCVLHPAVEEQTQIASSMFPYLEAGKLVMIVPYVSVILFPAGIKILDMHYNLGKIQLRF